mmetsp:Transcript_62/g.98  ORF Transcript_62/g.98 Transcript_62/m.98 type:complete len:80 (+) Transcript_62:841-1080(+)
MLWVVDVDVTSSTDGNTNNRTRTRRRCCRHYLNPMAASASSTSALKCINLIASAETETETQHNNNGDTMNAPKEAHCVI